MEKGTRIPSNSLFRRMLRSRSSWAVCGATLGALGAGMILTEQESISSYAVAVGVAGSATLCMFLIALFTLGWRSGRGSREEQGADRVSANPENDEADTGPAKPAPNPHLSEDNLIAVVSADIEIGVSAGLLTVLKWADYERVGAFDSGAAERFLKAFAERLKAVVAKDRPVVRSDHSSFMIWITGDHNGIAGELRGIKYALSADLETFDGVLSPQVEVTGAFYPKDAVTAESLLSRGRVLPISFTEKSSNLGLDEPHVVEQLAQEFAIEQQLRHAIERNELELHYQPVIDVRSQRLAGAEALLRWRSKEMGSISPVRFIPVMEKIGLADHIGTWVLNEACREAARWKAMNLDAQKVAVNISHNQIANPLFSQAIATVIRRSGAAPAMLELELTETAASRHIERTRVFFGQMAALGVNIAIDDFGTGYSSLSYLKQLRFHKLKIDREFVTNVHERTDSQAICKSLITLARGLGIDVLAEGAETVEEVKYLVNSGCYLFQGYYFSKPLTAQAFREFCLRREWLDSIKAMQGYEEMDKKSA